MENFKAVPDAAVADHSSQQLPAQFGGDPLSVYREPLPVGGRPRFGVSLPTSGPFVSPSNVLEVARHAAAAGYHDVWCNDYYDWPVEKLNRSPAGAVEAIQGQDPDFYEGLTTLALVGSAVPDIGVAMHGLTLPVRDVRLTVRQLSTIQTFLGRLTVAPAIGIQDSYQLIGVSPPARGKRLDEALEAITTILGSEHPVSFDGSYTRFADATLYPRPRSIGLWITGDSAAALSRVIRYGTGWFSTMVRVERFSDNLDQLRRMADEAGRSYEEIERATDIYVCVADTDAEAARISDATLVDRFGSLERGRERTAVGSPDAVVERLQALLDLGFTYLELRFICMDVESLLDMIDRVAAEVLPRLQPGSGGVRQSG